MLQVIPYPEINAFLTNFSEGVQAIFRGQLVGVYLFGSLSYGDFVLERSDIDLVVITKSMTNEEQYLEIEALSKQMDAKFPSWVARWECSYVPLNWLDSNAPPIEPRPYYGEGTLCRAEYGNEWIINKYLLYQHGLSVVGPNFNTLIKEIPIEAVQKACIRDLEKEWAPKLNDDAWLSNQHYQSYLVLNLCRILHTVLNGKVSSKKVSGDWVKEQFPQWQELIDAASTWHYGQDMNKTTQTKEFLQFAIDRVSQIR